MTDRTLTVAMAYIVVHLRCSSFASQPKALRHRIRFYKGKAAGMRIVFEFDHGHVEASNVKITVTICRAGKTTEVLSDR